MTRKELERVGQVLNCGGKGGKPGPCKHGKAAEAATKNAIKKNTSESHLKAAKLHAKAEETYLGTDIGKAVHHGSMKHWHTRRSKETDTGL